MVKRATGTTTARNLNRQYQYLPASAGDDRGTLSRNQRHCARYPQRAGRSCYIKYDMKKDVGAVTPDMISMALKALLGYRRFEDSCRACC